MRVWICISSSSPTIRLCAHGILKVVIAIQEGFPRKTVNGRKFIRPHVAEFLRGKDRMSSFVKLRAERAEQAEQFNIAQTRFTKTGTQARRVHALRNG